MSARDETPPPAVGAVETAPKEGRELLRAFLTEDEERAWTGLLETHQALVSALDRRLLAEHELPLSSFDALMHTAHAEDGTIPIAELASHIHVSPSHTSRLVIDLERRGLVRRERNPNDSRSTRAVITKAGRTQLRSAAATYLSTVKALLFDPLDKAQVGELARALGAIEASGADQAGIRNTKSRLKEVRR